MPTTVATPTDITKTHARITTLEDRVALLEAQLGKLMQELVVLTGGTATEEVGD